MAGGGIGDTTAKPNAAAPVPSGLSLDGSPKFEAANPVAEASSTPATTPAAGVMPAQRPGTNFMGLPPWMSMFFGGQTGTPTAPTANTPSTPGNYTPFVPGTNLSGYGMARDRVIYQPPPKPVPATPDPSKSSTGIPDFYDFAANPNYALYAGIPGYGQSMFTGPQPTQDQLRMKQWLDADARARAQAVSMEANANGRGA